MFLLWTQNVAGPYRYIFLKVHIKICANNIPGAFPSQKMSVSDFILKFFFQHGRGSEAC